jgi:hypothetical protein
VPSRELADLISFWAGIAALVAILLNVLAVVYAAGQLKVARRAAAGASLIPLAESFRQAWLQFRQAADEPAKQHTFADIMNLLEVACAIFEDGLLIGGAGKLLEDYLCHVFAMLNRSPDAQQRIERMVHTAKTFEHIGKFLRSHREQIREDLSPGGHL